MYAARVGKSCMDVAGGNATIALYAGDENPLPHDKYSSTPNKEYVCATPQSGRLREFCGMPSNVVVS